VVNFFCLCSTCSTSNHIYVCFCSFLWFWKNFTHSRLAWLSTGAE